MYIKNLCAIAAVLMLSACSSSNDLTAGGQRVQFSEQQPGSECQLLGNATGSQSNWFSGTGNESGSMRGAANDLRNKAASMGGNVVYNVSSPSESFLTNFIPTDSELSGQVYKCP